MTEYFREERLLIDGELVQATGARTYENINPATEEVIGVAADAGTEDIERAIAAGRRAFDETDWSRDHSLRSRCLRQLHDAKSRPNERRPTPSFNSEELKCPETSPPVGERRPPRHPRASPATGIIGRVTATTILPDLTGSPNLEVLAQFATDTGGTLDFAEAFSNYLDDLFLFAPTKISTQVPNPTAFTPTGSGALMLKAGFTGPTFSSALTSARYLAFGLVQNTAEGATQTALVMAYITNGNLGPYTGTGAFALNEITLNEISATTVAIFTVGSNLPATLGDILLI